MPPTTLATAMKYIKLLWGDRAHENLMKSINPLGQLEISMDNGRGGKETRYLQFDFHRVVGPKGGVKHVLCSVGDITSNVLLAKELQESQENANAQVDMMVGMMHVDPLQLGVLPRYHRDRPAADQRDPQGAGAHRRGVPQEARRPVPRAALDQGRGLGART